MLPVLFMQVRPTVQAPVPQQISPLPPQGMQSAGDTLVLQPRFGPQVLPWQQRPEAAPQAVQIALLQTKAGGLWDIP